MGYLNSAGHHTYMRADAQHRAHPNARTRLHNHMAFLADTNETMLHCDKDADNDDVRILHSF